MSNRHRLGRALAGLALLLAFGLAQATTYTFTAYKSGAGTGTVTSAPAGIDCGSTCSAAFDSGTSLTLTATPSGDSVFTGWTGWCTGTAPTCTVAMTGNRYAYATFAPPTLPITISKPGTGDGSVTSNPAGIDCGDTCAAEFATNSTVTLTATPAADSIFKYWSGCTSSSGTTCTVSLTAAKTVTATFAPAVYPLTVATSGADTGTVTSSPAGIDCGEACTADFANGSSVTLTASAAGSYTFQGWSGSCSGTKSTCTLSMTAAKSVIATFDYPKTTYYYDANGNLTQVTDPLGKVRKTNYDALDRPYLAQEPHVTTIGSTGGQITTAYDGQDQAASVTDPRNLKTTYSVDGLGNLLTLTSPDTGSTTATYDAAGNLKTRTDARGITATYQYDAANRLTQISYGDQTVSLTWDACANGIGRLCGVADASGSTAYAYDGQGRLLTQTQTVAGVSLVLHYGYDADGHAVSLTLPSGRGVGYGWNAGRMTSLTVDGGAQLTDIAYQPFGPVSGWTWGNGQVQVRRFDLAGRLKETTLGNQAGGQVHTRGLSYDAAGRIVALVDGLDTHLDQSFAYDGLDRLVASRLNGTSLTTLSYAYDLSGNRSKRILNGVSTTYGTSSTSNRLMTLTGGQSKAYAYDAMGNVTSDGTLSFGYDNAGRRVWAKAGSTTTTFAYNALGQRVQKTGPAGTVLYAYDPAGQLIGEYDAGGNPIQETVWLGDIPVLTVRGGGIYYVHADHLNTPRRITRPSDNLPVWAWEAEPFGTGLPDQNPAGLGDFAYNLRMPGQVYDQETGLFYNYYRDYDPNTGRYGESDPIGLDGGVNTYLYVGGNPVGFIDLLGLICTCDPVTTANAAKAHDGEWGWGNPGWRGGFGWFTEFKCNKFVNQVTTEGGSSPPLVNNRPATAGELGDPGVSVPNWPVVQGPAKPGDVVAISHTGPGYTGHTGVVVGPSSTASANSNTRTVTVNDWGFRPGQRPVLRRCTCP